MIPIRFRGITKSEPHRWGYGDLIIRADRTFIIPECEFSISALSEVMFEQVYEVIPDTVGQFTGLTDCTGTEAYEGDRITRSHSSGKGIAKGEIAFELGRFITAWQNDQWNDCAYLHLPESKITGTIHDHLLTQNHDKQGDSL